MNPRNLRLENCRVCVLLAFSGDDSQGSSGATCVFTVGILLTGSMHKAAPCFEGYREDQQTEIQAPPSSDITANGRGGQSQEGLHCQGLYSHLHVTGGAYIHSFVVVF